VRHLAADLGVFEVVEIIPIRIEYAVAAEPERLMDLEIKTDRSHIDASGFEAGSIRTYGNESTSRRTVNCDLPHGTFFRRWDR
jgi:hypothetical protein